MTKNLDGTTTQSWSMTDLVGVRTLLEELFTTHWAVLVVGPCIQGAVFEWRFRAPPAVTYRDGYLTVSEDGEHSPHFHVCVGEHRGTSHHPVPPELAQWRRTGRAEFFRDQDARCTPASWGLRLWNGRDEQQLTVFFPNPHLDPATMRRRRPDWSALDLWMAMRERYAGIPVEAPPAVDTAPIH
jgi:hypothetical protein